MAKLGRMAMAGWEVSMVVAMLVVAGGSAGGGLAGGPTRSPSLRPGRGGWGVPQVVARGEILTSVSCATPRFCEALGTNGGAAYASTWSDGHWSAPKRLGDFTFTPQSLACPANGVCVTAADSGLSWLRGGTWSPPSDVRRLLNAAGTSGNTLSAVSCAGEAFCVAVGADSHFFSGSGALVWDGRSWSEPLPMPTSASTVSCTARSFCAAGSVALTGSSGGFEVFDGSRWSRAPNSAVQGSVELSCVRPSFCMEVGGASPHGDMASVFDGTSWSSVKGPPRATGGAGFAGVSCASPSFCMASDTTAYPSPRGPGIFMWDGSSWSAPMSVGRNLLPDAVSCPTPTFCMAVGASGDAAVWRAATSFPNPNRSNTIKTTLAHDRKVAGNDFFNEVCRATHGAPLPSCKVETALEGVAADGHGGVLVAVGTSFNPSMGCTPNKPIWFFDNERLLTTSDRLNLAHSRGMSIFPEVAVGDGTGRLALRTLEWLSSSFCPSGPKADAHYVTYVLSFNGSTLVATPAGSSAPSAP